jgi:glutaredoxin
MSLQITMDQLEQQLLKRYLALKERPAKLREVVQPYFILNAILFVPMFLGALLIFFLGVREAAYIVLGMWLGMFVADIRQARIFIKLWPHIKKYLDWDKIEKHLNEQNKIRAFHGTPQAPTELYVTHKTMSKIAPRLGAIIRATLLSLLVIITSVAGLYCFDNRDRIFPEKNTVVVYGREACAITKMVRAGLTEKGIPYIFANIDIGAINDELRYKLGPKFKEPSYTLPVVHVAGKLLLTPSADHIQEELSQAPPSSTRDYSTFLNGADPVPHY